MKIDKYWRKYYKKNVENEELCYEVVENAYSFGRRTERKRIVEEIQKLKENTEPKHIDFRHTPSTILDELLKIIQ